jgi:hypothetical protein
LLSHERAAGRELFSENALALKCARLSLAIEKGHVVAPER